MDVIETDNLGVAYAQHAFSLGRRPSRAILKNINLTVKAGEVFVLLGHNGAGKTTLLKVLLNFLPIQSGSASLFGIDVRYPESRTRVGVLFEQPQLYAHHSAPQFLRFFSEVLGLDKTASAERIESLLKKTGLNSHGDKPLPAYSKGMLQRLNLCRCLLADPDLIILDEPILGLDPLGQGMVREMVRELKQQGKTVFINTHSTSFAFDVADRIAFMVSGTIAETIRPSELRLDIPPFRVRVRQIPPAFVSQFQQEFPQVTSSTADHVELILPDFDSVIRIIERSVSEGFYISHISGTVDPLQSRFMELTAHLTDQEKSQ